MKLRNRNAEAWREACAKAGREDRRKAAGLMAGDYLSITSFDETFKGGRGREALRYLQRDTSPHPIRRNPGWLDEGYGTDRQHSTFLDRLARKLLAVHPEMSGRIRRELRGEAYDRSDVLILLPPTGQGTPIEIWHGDDFDELVVGMGTFWHVHYDTKPLDQVAAAIVHLMDSGQVAYERLDATGKIREAGTADSLQAVTPHPVYETRVFSWSGKDQKVLPPA